MKTLLISGLLALLATTAGAQGNFYIETCVLNCTSGAHGNQVFCGVTNVFRNGQISWMWSDTIDLYSVTPASLQIFDALTGQSVIGAYTLQDAGRRLVFTPATFQHGHLYSLLIPGREQGDLGPFVMSTSGVPNLSRLDCTIVTSLGDLDIGADCVVSSNSVGVGALMSFAGSSSISQNDLAIEILGLPVGQPALFVVSDSPSSLPFGDGVLCLGQPVRRIQPLIGTGTGSVSLNVNVNALPPGLIAAPGQLTWFQLWYRDPKGGPQGFNLSNSLRVVWRP